MKIWSMLHGIYSTYAIHMYKKMNKNKHKIYKSLLMNASAVTETTSVNSKVSLTQYLCRVTDIC